MAGESAQEMARRAREKAARLEARADRWEQGGVGEQATAKTLGSLPPGWSALHDVRWPGRPRANLDHVLVGPGGIFVIDTKNWNGQVSVTDDVLRQNGRSREQTVAAAADASLAVAALIGSRAAHVHPVLCFVQQPDLAGWCRDVMVCSTDNLVDMLQTRPAVLGSQEVAEVTRRLQSMLAPATAPPSSRPSRTQPKAEPTVLVSTPRTPRTLASRSRKRRQPSLGRFMVGVVLALGLITLGPRLLPHVEKQVAKVVVTPVARPSSCPSRVASTRDQVTNRRRQKKETSAQAIPGRPC